MRLRVFLGLSQCLSCLLRKRQATAVLFGISWPERLGPGLAWHWKDHVKPRTTAIRFSREGIWLAFPTLAIYSSSHELCWKIQMSTSALGQCVGDIGRLVALQGVSTASWKFWTESTERGSDVTDTRTCLLGHENQLYSFLLVIATGATCPYSWSQASGRPWTKHSSSPHQPSFSWESCLFCFSFHTLPNEGSLLSVKLTPLFSFSLPTSGSVLFC